MRLQTHPTLRPPPHPPTRPRSDRGSLADAIGGGKLAPPDPAQRMVWVLLCGLDLALGLDCMHQATIIHGDLKPANVMLKGTRNDRRGFVCKLGDFGLSRRGLEHPEWQPRV